MAILHCTIFDVHCVLLSFLFFIKLYYYFSRPDCILSTKKILQTNCFLVRTMTMTCQMCDVDYVEQLLRYWCDRMLTTHYIYRVRVYVTKIIESLLHTYMKGTRYGYIQHVYAISLIFLFTFDVNRCQSQFCAPNTKNENKKNNNNKSTKKI